MFIIIVKKSILTFITKKLATGQKIGLYDTVIGYPYLMIFVKLSQYKCSKEQIWSDTLGQFIIIFLWKKFDMNYTKIQSSTL